MARYRLTLAYDGTPYHGFQRQAGAPTVQGKVEDALRKIGWAGDSILAAGRTDAGVHALGQVIAVDIDWGHPPTDLQNALNANLPEEIAVQSADRADPDFHPRYDARSREYRYHLFCHPVRQPLRERFAWRLWPEPALDRLRDAARHLLGEHDFSAFGRPPQPGGTTVRTVYQAEWERREDALTFTIEGNAFLYHMVRRIVHLLVEVGQGKHPAHLVRAYRNRKTPNPVQGLAPANGLILTRVRY